MRRLLKSPNDEVLMIEAMIRRAEDVETGRDGIADAATLLERLRGELARLSTRVLEMQSVLGPVLADAADDHRILHGCQDLDLVAQSLEGLSDFLAVVRPHGGAGTYDLAGAAAVVKLGDLAARLLGEETGSAGPAGEPELF